MAVSACFGILAAGLLAIAPFVPATESGVTGGICLGLGLGWAALAALSERLSDRPQTWAVAPALFLGAGGLALVAFGAPMRDALAWVWPPALLALVVWMIARARRRLPSRSARVLLFPPIAFLVLAALGGGYVTVHEAVVASAEPTRGRLIDVGGHRLYLDCTGSGRPTVVLEPGAGDASSALDRIAPAVSRDTRVCIYDRAGRGWSDPTAVRQDAERISSDLRTLLQRGQESGPYVLAGHSFGGLYSLVFSAAYPDEVAGLVLIDSTAPASDPEPTHAPPSGPDDATERGSALVEAAARLGLGRVLGFDTVDELRSTMHEYLQGGASVLQAAALSDFGDKPLVVLTAGSGSDPESASRQEALAALSRNASHRVIDGATHTSLITEQEDAAETVRAILDVVAAVRTAEPLGGAAPE